MGDKAPLLIGKKAIGKGLLKLRSLMKEVSYEKYESGLFKEVNGKYVLNIKNNVVVLNFFSTTCIPCLKEIPAYNRIAERFRHEAVKLIYVNVQPNISRPQIRRFIARKQIRVPMMMPNQKETLKKYDVVSLPKIVIINRKGEIDYIIRGFQAHLERFLIEHIDGLLHVP